MFSESLTISELKAKLQENHQQEIDIILEILAESGDSYFFGVDELRDILDSQTSKQHHFPFIIKT